MKRVLRVFLVIILIFGIAKYGASTNSPSTPTKISTSQVVSNNTEATLAPSSSSSSTAYTNSTIQQNKITNKSITLSDFKNDSFTLEYARKLSTIHGLEFKNSSSGSGVKAIQKLLASFGYLSNSGIDGAFGSGTEKAISKFQSDYGLAQTGIADISTQFLLLIKSPEAEFSETAKGTISVSIGNYAFFYWKDGTSYVGQIEGSDSFYNGTYIYSTAEYYAGQFSHDKRSGKGTAYFSNGDVYIGDWENDKMNGNGKYYFGGLNSKETYDGEWANNTMSGKGTYTLSNGTKITGKWSNNKHISW